MLKFAASSSSSLRPSPPSPNMRSCAFATRRHVELLGEIKECCGSIAEESLRSRSAVNE